MIIPNFKTKGKKILILSKKKMVQVQFIIQMYKNKKNKQGSRKEWTINNVMYRWEHSGLWKQKDDVHKVGEEEKVSS